MQHPPFWLWHPTPEHWAEVLKPDVIWPPLRKSLVVATGTAALAVVIAAPAAYVIAAAARLALRGRAGAAVHAHVPRGHHRHADRRNLPAGGLINTDLGLILAHLIRNLPFVAWILVGHIRGDPARPGGGVVGGRQRAAGHAVSVVLPLALPGIAVAAIFAWLDSWNDLLYAIYLLLAERTLPLMTYYFANRGSVFDVATFSVVLTVPCWC